MAKGESRYAADLLAVPGLRQDGARISLEFTITLIKDEESSVLGPQPSSGRHRSLATDQELKSACRRWQGGIGLFLRQDLLTNTRAIHHRPLLLSRAPGSNPATFASLGSAPQRFLHPGDGPGYFGARS